PMLLRGRRNAADRVRQLVMTLPDLQSHRARHVGRPNVKHIDTWQRSDSIDRIDRRFAFNLQYNAGLFVRRSHIFEIIVIIVRGAPRSDATSAERRVLGRVDCGLALSRGLDHRHHDTGDARIERAPDKVDAVRPDSVNYRAAMELC